MKRNSPAAPYDVRRKYDIKGNPKGGGNGIVYFGARKSDGTQSAIKVLKRRERGKQYRSNKVRFQREIAVMKNWSRKTDRIIPILEIGARGDWYSMPKAETCTDALKHDDEGTRARRVVREMSELAKTLARLHSKGICHRDIKPANILFHDGHFVLSDFGLVKDDAIKSDLTIGQKRLGPVFTMAPEMRRSPAGANAAAADVYSLGKTLWMLLSADDKGFEGQYTFSDATVQLHRDGRYRDLPLARIEMLLNRMTDNDPNLRPSAGDCAKEMDSWLNEVDEWFLAQRKEWDLMAKMLFNDKPPRRAEYRDAGTIVAVLNQLAVRPSYNHMLYPDGGGLDLLSAKFANEDGFVEIHAGSAVDIFKPKCLHVEVYPEGENSYFLLETEELPLLEGVDDDGPISQLVVEDAPGRYVSARAAQYGVYDYDSGRRLPDGFRVVRRYVNGKFLIVAKIGPYNHLPESYDALHNKVSVEKFREYMDQIARAGKKWVKTEYGGVAFPAVDSLFAEKIRLRKRSAGVGMCFVEGRLRDEIEGIDFSAMIANLPRRSANSRLKFWVSIDGLGHGSNVEQLLSERSCILQDNGHFRLDAVPGEKTFYLYSRNDVEGLCSNLRTCLDELYENGLFGNVRIRGEWKLVAKPDHVFSRDDLERVLKDADDRHCTRVVVDENGDVKVVNEQEEASYALYPVRNEAYSAGNGYVGKYADYSQKRLDELYGSLLNAFYDYLQTGQSQYVDFLFSGDVQQLRKDVDAVLNGTIKTVRDK